MLVRGVLRRCWFRAGCPGAEVLSTDAADPDRCSRYRCSRSLRVGACEPRCWHPDVAGILVVLDSLGCAQGGECILGERADGECILGEREGVNGRGGEWKVCGVPPGEVCGEGWCRICWICWFQGS